MVRALEQRFQGFTLKHIPRSKNVEADALAKAAANNLPIPEGTFYQVLGSPAIETASKAFQMVLLTECEDWRQAITYTLHNVSNPEDEANAARMVARVRMHHSSEGEEHHRGPDEGGYAHGLLVWGASPLSTPEGGLTLTKGRVRSLLELDRVRNSEHSSYSFKIKHVNNLEIYG
jgi:hypothetical protein